MAVFAPVSSNVTKLPVLNVVEAPVQFGVVVSQLLLVPPVQVSCLMTETPLTAQMAAWAPVNPVTWMLVRADVSVTARSSSYIRGLFDV